MYYEQIKSGDLIIGKEYSAVVIGTRTPRGILRGGIMPHEVQEGILCFRRSMSGEREERFKLLTPLHGIEEMEFLHHMV
ncbi:hypothetical protein HYX00_00535 [Candidatus Woesearchaeota archaeon]|nr:hypothetical protein [Candidatus Woesearchaeota archaeon]